MSVDPLIELEWCTERAVGVYAAPADVVRSPAFLIGVVVLIAVIILGAGMIAWAKRWTERSAEKDAPGTDELSEYRNLLQQGELSQEEFDKICRTVEKVEAEPDQTEGQEEPPRDIPS